MKFRVLDDQVLVELDREVEATDGGLLIPETARHRSRWGTVLAVGSGKRTKAGVRMRPLVTKCDRVCVPWDVGQDVFFGPRDCKIVREHDLLAIEGPGE